MRYFRNIIIDQKSPDHPVSKSRGGSLSVKQKYGHLDNRILEKPFYLFIYFNFFNFMLFKFLDFFKTNFVMEILGHLVH